MSASTLAQPPGASRTRHVVLTILSLLYLISYLDRTTISVAAPKIIAEFHFSNAQMGAIFSSFAMTYALLQTGAFFFLEVAVSGLMNTEFGPAGVISPIPFGVMVDRLGSWTPPFIVGVGLLHVGVFGMTVLDTTKVVDVPQAAAV